MANFLNALRLFSPSKAFCGGHDFESKGEDEERRRDKEEIHKLRLRVVELEAKMKKSDLSPVTEGESEGDGVSRLSSLSSHGGAMGSSARVMEASNPEDAKAYYREKGVFVRPACMKKKLRKGREGPPCNTDEGTKLYSSFSQLGAVMAQCKHLGWKTKMFTPLAKKAASIAQTIPKVTLREIESILNESHHPATARICTDIPHDMDFEATSWEDLDWSVIWSNRANHKMWGTSNLDELKACHDQMRENNVVYRMNMEAQFRSTFLDKKVEPKRFLYTYFGNDLGVKKQGSFQVAQISPMLVEVDKKVYFGLFYEYDAPKKYQSEIHDIVLRSHTVFRYSEASLVVFTPCGVILQQNPVANIWFGMESAENTVYSDFDSNGNPVDRIKALFAGGNEALYDEMWETVMEKQDHWFRKIKVYKHNLKPDNLDLTKSMADSRSFGSSFASPEPEGLVPNTSELELMYGPPKWIYVSFNKINDPSNGQVLLTCAMRDVTDLELQKQKYIAARKMEKELLQSIIPTHIIEHLVEENKIRKSSDKSSSDKSSSDSDSSLMNLSACQMTSEMKMRKVAEHHPEVTVFFADIVGFTKISSQSDAGDVMIMLNTLFTMLDDKCDEHFIYKVETIGDAYMAVAGLNLKSERAKLKPEEVPKACGKKGKACPRWHATRMVDFANDALVGCASVKTPQGAPLQVRIGIHSGDVMTGVVGHKMPRFCLFGDTVNVASRMESTGRPGMIHASQATRDLTSQESWVATGGVEAKGKGLVETYLLSHDPDRLRNSWQQELEEQC